MAIFSIRLPAFITGIIAFGAALVIGTPAGGGEHASFSRDVLPILQQHCGECHQPGGAGQQKSGLDLSTYEGVMKGTNFGAIVVPGNSFTSNLSVLIEGRARPEINMPHNRAPLSKWQRHLIRRWIDKGAKNN
ncbi:MAG: hypothetical protein O3A85_06435 [Proteobacteria bacterium]|nr:hypothetical protein [Pseudomonadota bacterium]